MTRISETELILPVLHILSSQGATTTTDLIGLLRGLLQPTGEDLEILKGRNDDKFSQKVRNLKAHDALTSRGLAEEEKHPGQSTAFVITDKGKKLYLANKSDLNTLLSFPQDQTKRILSDMANSRRIKVLDEGTAISEGEIISGKEKKKRRRSRQLRNAAIEHYTKNGSIVCHACSFEFNKVYGRFGKNYIEIHHLTPICEYEGELVLDINVALESVAPLCANCHRVVHLHRPILSIRAVKRSLRASSRRND